MSDSGVVSEDTARAVNEGRETVGVLLKTAQKRLQVVFVAFVIGLFGGIVAMRSYIWPMLKHDLIQELGLGSNVDVIFQTPFDVILLQVKIGLFVGIAFALPVLLYYAKDPLADRGIIQRISISRLQIVGVVIAAAVLAVLGVVYSYDLFFPLMFRFLANNALSANLQPRYSIVSWTQFILVLAGSFAIAAQLPLVMGGLSYGGIVPYETFYAYRKHAIVLIFVFGAVCSPPDVFTQLMWALPLLGLYGFSLYVSKVVTYARRGSQRVDARSVVRSRWNVLAGGAVVGFLLGYGFFGYGGVAALNRTIGSFSKYSVPSATGLVGLGPNASLAVVGVVVGVVGFVVAVGYVLYDALEGAASAENDVYSGKERIPENFNLGILDADGVRAAPEERFEAMDEEEALELANEAMADDDEEKAAAILDRFDAAEAASAEDADGEGGEASADAAETADEESGNVFSRTGAGMLDAFTEDETTEDDIGGYYHDLRFIVASLRSRLFWIAGWFMVVLAVVFGFLYTGGLGAIRNNFISHIPAQVVQNNPNGLNWPIVLHPVEALVFEAKMSAVVAVIATAPLILYFAWPAFTERGFVTAPRRVVWTWAGGLVASLVGGSVIGYRYVAPYLISWLVTDALQSNVVISYRISDFLWLVFLTTVGIGLLAAIPVSMWLSHGSGIVGYHRMREHWRVFVLGGFVFAALVTPSSLYTMVVVGVPIAFAFFVGLAGLWVVTLGGRRGGGGPEPEAPEADAAERPA